MAAFIRLFSCNQVDYSGHNDAYRCGEDGLCDSCITRLYIIGLTLTIVIMLGVIVYLVVK